MPINPLVRTILSALLFIASVLAVYFAGRIDGHRAAMQAAEKEKAEIIATYQAATLAAEIRYSEQLAKAAAEKQQWFDFAQEQSTQLAAAKHQLDMQTAKLQEQIPHAVQNDGNGFTGIGADSLHLYNRALGYAD